MNRMVHFFRPLFFWGQWAALFTIILRLKSDQVHPLYAKLGRTTSVAFLLDPLEYYVWPHPRKENLSFTDIGVVVARWLVRFQNPGLNSRPIDYLEGKHGTEINNKELAWRQMMFETYGDKWPDGITEMPIT